MLCFKAGLANVAWMRRLQRGGGSCREILSFLQDAVKVDEDVRVQSHVAGGTSTFRERLLSLAMRLFMR